MVDDTVVPLREITSLPDAGGVVEQLEEVLLDARAGKLSMIAIATVERDGSTGRCWSTAHNTATLIGAIEMMKRDIVEKNRECSC